MELKTGFKQTEVGVIPEDWELKLLPDVADITNGKAHEQFIVDQGNYVLVNAKFISSNGRVRKFTDKNFCPAKRDSIIIVMSDVPNGKALAKCFFVDEDDRYAVNQSVCAFKPKNVYPTYLFYYLNRNKYFLRFDDGIQQTHLLNNVFRRCPVIVPSKVEEQRAIAEALSDTDALIESLEQLIAKKRCLKQGAMQELLTGKKRLPGFSGKWEVKRLGDVADIDPDNLGSSTNADYAFNYISLEDVDVGSLRSYSEQVFHSAPSRARRRLRAGDILVSTVRPNLQSHLMFTSTEPDWICSTGFSVVRCKSQEAAPGYVFCHIFGHFVTKQIETLITGSNYPAINSKDVKALEIPMPKFPEQTAIATVLSDMDAEITSLETKLVKTRQLKQGMMHNLLTGKIRLNHDKLSEP